MESINFFVSILIIIFVTAILICLFFCILKYLSKRNHFERDSSILPIYKPLKLITENDEIKENPEIIVVQDSVKNAENFVNINSIKTDENNQRQNDEIIKEESLSNKDELMNIFNYELAKDVKDQNMECIIKVLSKLLTPFIDPSETKSRKLTYALAYARLIKISRKILEKENEEQKDILIKSAAVSDLINLFIDGDEICKGKDIKILLKLGIIQKLILILNSNFNETKNKQKTLKILNLLKQIILMDSKKCDEISKENGIPILVKLMNCSKNLLIRKQAAFILIDVIEKRQFCEFHRVKACDRLKIKDDKDGIPDNCKKIVETDAILLLLSKQLKCPKSPDWKLCKRILTLFETVSEEKIRKYLYHGIDEEILKNIVNFLNPSNLRRCKHYIDCFSNIREIILNVSNYNKNGKQVLEKTGAIFALINLIIYPNYSYFALNSILKIAKSAPNLINSEIISRLAEHFCLIDIKIHSGIIKIFKKLSKKDSEIQKICIEAGIVPYLIKYLDASVDGGGDNVENEKIKKNAAKTLLNIVKKDKKYIADIIEGDGLKALIKFLVVDDDDHMRYDTIKMVLKVSIQNVQALINAGTVPYLIQILNSNNNFLISRTLKTMLFIAAGRDEQKEVLIENGTIPILADLLRNVNVETRIFAKFILQEIAAGNNPKHISLMSYMCPKICDQFNKPISIYKRKNARLKIIKEAL